MVDGLLRLPLRPGSTQTLAPKALRGNNNEFGKTACAGASNHIIADLERSDAFADRVDLAGEIKAGGEGQVGQHAG